MKTLYRTYNSDTTQRTTVNISPETQKGIERIKAAFYSRFPKDKYDPGFSLIFEKVIEKATAELEADPDYLAVEVADYERRYKGKS